MKKVLVILCAVLMTAGYASGHDMKKLLKQVRRGETDAYKSLAICCRDGNGVGKSWLNMMSVYEIYALKTSGELEGVLDILEEGHPFRLLTNVLCQSRMRMSNPCWQNCGVHARPKRRLSKRQ